MNSNWRNRPTTIDFVSRDIDYLISIDESGTSNLKRIQNIINNGGKLDEQERHFAVTAVLIDMKKFNLICDKIMALKNKYWVNGLFRYKDLEKRVCFHSREIRMKKTAFSPQVINYEQFISDLSLLMNELPITLYASHIDKFRHVKQYKIPNSPYDLCMSFVLERIMKDIKKDRKCIIILESRGKKEDKHLLDFMKNLLDNGNYFNAPTLFKKIQGVYFNPKWSKLDNEKKSYWELELADLCAYPIFKYFVYGKSDKAFEILKHKLSYYPNYYGKGLKSFP